MRTLNKAVWWAVTRDNHGAKYNSHIRRCDVHINHCVAPRLCVNGFLDHVVVVSELSAGEHRDDRYLGESDCGVCFVGALFV